MLHRPIESASPTGYEKIARNPDSAASVGDPALGQIVGGELNRYLVTAQDSNVVLSHLAGDVCSDDMSVLKLNSKLSVRQRLDDGAFHFNMIFFGQILLLGCQTGAYDAPGPERRKVPGEEEVRRDPRAGGIITDSPPARAAAAPASSTMRNQRTGSRSILCQVPLTSPWIGLNFVL